MGELAKQLGKESWTFMFEDASEEKTEMLRRYCCPDQLEKRKCSDDYSRQEQFENEKFNSAPTSPPLILLLKLRPRKCMP